MQPAYDNKCDEIQGIIAEMFNLPRHETESYQYLRDLVNAKSIVRQLEAVCEPALLMDQLLIHIYKRQSPRATNAAWEEHRSFNIGMRLPTFEDYLKFLEARARGLKEFDVGPTSSQQSSSSTSKRGTASSRFKPYGKSKSYGGQRTRERSYAPRRCIML